MNDIKVAVVDTLIDFDNELIKNSNVTIASMSNFNNVILKNNYTGHGTAVVTSILNAYPDANISLYPVFKDEFSTIDESLLIETLQHICNQNKFDILNLSLGIVELENVEVMRKVCDELMKQDCTIVSAFSNSMMLSYPAVFENVIGIAGIEHIRGREDYIYNENSPINIVASSCYRKVSWSDPKYVFSNGNSFIAPIFTGKICRYKAEGKVKINDIIISLKRDAQKVNKFFSPLPLHKIVHQNVVLFPFNKEMHALVRFQADTVVTIKNVYDYKYSSNLTKKASSIMSLELEKDFVVHNIESLEFNEEFDSIILGHIDELVKVIGFREIDFLVSKAYEYKKNIFCFDSKLYKRYENTEFKEIITYNEITELDVPKKNLKKQWVINTPVVGVFGTQSQQGKFTLQIQIKKYLSSIGYKVGHLSSEPTGKLFGSDHVFPFGYNGEVHVNDSDRILVLNEMLHEIQDKSTDIIIVGSQSSMIPYDYYNSKQININQYSFLMGTLPDIVFLSISCNDEIDYIQRTVSFIETSSEAKIIGLVLFPVIKKNYSNMITKKEVIKDISILEKYESYFYDALGIPCYSLNEAGIEKHIQNMLDFLIEE